MIRQIEEIDAVIHRIEKIDAVPVQMTMYAFFLFVNTFFSAVVVAVHQARVRRTAAVNDLNVAVKKYYFIYATIGCIHFVTGSHLV